ncbi:MAG: hypothetical protein K6F59_00300, partial [Gammaproteobacteria bacterium]|nr:hypothetical protein [Gammaproteobacteria bacterium]
NGSRWLNTEREGYHVGSGNIFKLRLNVKDSDGDFLEDLSNAPFEYVVKVGSTTLTKSTSTSITVGSKTYSGIVFADGTDEYLYILNDEDKSYLSLQFTALAVGQDFTIEISLAGSTDEKVTLEFNVNAGVNVENNAELRLYYADLGVTEINIHKTIIAELTSDQFREKNGRQYVINYEPGKQLSEAQSGRKTGDVYVRAVSDANTIGNELIVNGNYFTIDGSNLPIIDNVNPNTGYSVFDDEHRAVNFNSPLLVDGKNLYINNGQTSIFANLLAYADTTGSYNYELVDGGADLTTLSDPSDSVYSRGVGAYSLVYRQYSNSVTYNNLYIIGNTITPQVNYSQEEQYIKTEEELAAYNSGGFNGIMVRGCTAKTNNVVVDYTNIGLNASCDMAVMDAKDTYVFYSWGNSLYGWSSCTIKLDNCDFRYSGGACVHIDEHREERGSYEVYDCFDHSKTFTINFDPQLTIDRKSQLINWVTGAEIWFKLNGIAEATTPLVGGMNGIVQGLTDKTYSVVKAYNKLSKSDIAYSQDTSSGSQMWNFAVMMREGDFANATTNGNYALIDMNVSGQSIYRQPKQLAATTWYSFAKTSLEFGLMNPTAAMGNSGLMMYPVSPFSSFVDSLTSIDAIGQSEGDMAGLFGANAFGQGFDALDETSRAQVMGALKMVYPDKFATVGNDNTWDTWSAYALGLNEFGILNHDGTQRNIEDRYGYMEVSMDIDFAGAGMRGTIITYYYAGDLSK